MKLVKTITSHSGLARFLAETDEAHRWITRASCAHIPSPYHYSPVREVLFWKSRAVVWFETRHRRYEVFALEHGDAELHRSPEAAESANFQSA